jgi:hypothetical protein
MRYSSPDPRRSAYYDRNAAIKFELPESHICTGWLPIISGKGNTIWV